MKVDSLHLKQFTVFEDVELAFSPGINVFLGTNGTGKSHAMKALYAPLKAMEQEATELRGMKPLFRVSPDARYTNKLVNVFKPDRGDLFRLIHRGGKGEPAEVAFVADGARITYSLDPGRSIKVSQTPRTDEAKALFLPSRELLSMFDGFLAAYAGRELSFDETYYDACFSLSAKELKGARYDESAPLRAPLEAAIGGPVVLEGNRFIVRRSDGDMESPLLAEGLRKLASVAHLIANGSLSPGTAFFWDEPEAGLNAQLVVLVADLLLALAERGVQIFVATHDYLLSRRLSLISEYSTRPAAPMRFFLFQRVDDAVTVASGDELAALPEDTTSQEFGRQYDLARDLFDGAGPKP
jgi:AAA domain, putative AbiEii toxin, Type IV TA system